MVLVADGGEGDWSLAYGQWGRGRGRCLSVRGTAVRLEQWDLPWTTHICCHQVHLWTLDSPAAFKMAVLPREPHLPMGAI